MLKTHLYKMLYSFSGQDYRLNYFNSHYITPSFNITFFSLKKLNTFLLVYVIKYNKNSITSL